MDTMRPVSCPSNMQVFVKGLRRAASYAIDCAPEWTIDHIARVAEHRDGTSRRLFRFVYRGDMLCDEGKTLSECNITPETMLYMANNPF